MDDGKGARSVIKPFLKGVLAAFCMIVGWCIMLWILAWLVAFAATYLPWPKMFTG